jgi:adenylate cyclase
MKKPIRVLLVEDDPLYAAVLRDVCSLARSSHFNTTHVTRLDTALARLKTDRFDLVLLDLGLPDAEGLPVVTEVQKCVPALPIVILTGSDDDVVALEAAKLGAQDYLVKATVNAHILTRVMRYAIERKRADQVLREREEFFRLISDSMTDMVAVLDCEGRRLYNSPSYTAVLKDPDQLYGTISFDEIHPEDRERVKEIFHRTVSTGVGERAEYRFLLPSGEVRYVESQGSVIRNENGEVAKVVVVSRDMTERHQIEAQIRRLNQNLEQRVVERTAQLAAANVELQNEISERCQIEIALRAEQEKSESLLLNVLPKAIADRLKRGESTIAEHFADVNVMFADLAGFTELASHTAPVQLVNILNQIFSAFDRLADSHGLEKIKTIGDAYMAVSGLAQQSDQSADAVAEMALDMCAAIKEFNAQNGLDFKLRVGINSGPVIAGIIGMRKFSYDLWGTTVNIASRMQSTCPIGAIHISAATRERLGDRFEYIDRGMIQIKGHSEMHTYLLAAHRQLVPA